MFKIVRKEVQFGDAKLILETGRIARQATGAVLTTLGNTTVLATVVGKNAAPGQERDFFPLTVNYQEKTYAAGKIPGGFFKREGRPSEKETLTSRLIDRPLRPLFADGFKSEVQVMITVLSTDKQYDSDIAALIGASAAVAISGLPFNGPIGAARVGYVDDMYVLNPSYEEQARSDLDLVVAGTDQAVIMVESEAKELTEDQMLGGVLFGHQEMQGVITAIREFAAEVNPTPWEWSAPARDEVAIARVAGVFEAPITEAYQITNKKVRYDRLSELRQAAVDQLSTEDEASEETFDANRIKAAFSVVEKQCVRESVLAHKPRIDGRDHTSVRPIVAEVGVLSDTHGSALFTRGETQALVVATLGNDRDGQMVDALEGSRTE
ncbi:MAG: polyribonucleotide nucleotidyltransferase, partial [Gammaproteobacteria bacterium]